MRNICTLGLWVFVNFGVFSQAPGLASYPFRNDPSSPLIQPAGLALQDSETYRLGFIGHAWLLNNWFSIDKLKLDDNVVTEESKKQLIASLTTRNDLQVGYKMGVLFAFDLGYKRWSLGLHRMSTLVGSFSDSTAGLIMQGNAPYAGSTIVEDALKFNRVTLTGISTGTAWDWGDTQLGLRLTFSMVQNLSYVDRFAYRLGISDDGSRIDVNANYNVYATGSNKPVGGAIGLDIGCITRLSDQLSLQGAVSDLGFLLARIQQYGSIVDVRYEGVDWNQFIGGAGDFSSFSLGDTLQALFFPDTTLNTLLTSLPVRAFVGIDYEISEYDLIQASIGLGSSPFAATGKVPLIQAGYYHTFGESFTLGGNLYAGGIEKYGLGLQARWASELMYGGLFCSLKLDNFQGLLFPNSARSLGCSMGLGLSW